MLHHLLHNNILAYVNVRWGDCYHMNIGQMIEFLGDAWREQLKTNRIIIERDFSKNDDDVVVKEWLMPTNNKLCDALWEAVKYNLKKDVQYTIF